jgi:hypothetical protein
VLRAAKLLGAVVRAGLAAAAKIVNWHATTVVDDVGGE